MTYQPLVARATLIALPTGSIVIRNRQKGYHMKTPVATMSRWSLKTSLMLAVAAALGISVMFAVSRATPVAHAAANPAPSYSCIYREQVSNDTLYYAPGGGSGALVTATIWELAYYNPNDGGFLVGCNEYFAQAYLTSYGLEGNGAVYLYDAKTGSYLASAPTPILYGAGQTQSGYTDTVSASDGLPDGVTAKLGFKPVGAPYEYSALLGPYGPY